MGLPARVTKRALFEDFELAVDGGKSDEDDTASAALPPAGAKLADPNTPVNVNYVFGLDDTQAQQWMPAGVYLVVWMVALFALAFLPTHLVLKKFAVQNNAR